MTEILKVSGTDAKIINDLFTHLIGSCDNGTHPTIKSLEKLSDDDRSHLFAATIDGKIVGYSLTYTFPSLHSEDSVAYLYDIEVLPNYRRKGIGRLLISTMLSNLKSADVTELWLGTAVHNVAGQALFTATGAERSAETFNDFTYILSKGN